MREPAPHLPPIELPEQVLWLVDAPMFIDEPQVEAFYDATLRPDYEEASLNLSESLTRESTFGGKISVEAAIPWFTKGAAEGSGSRSKSAVAGKDATFTRVVNPYRHLLAIVLHYATEPDLKSRLVLASTGGKAADATGASVDLADPNFVTESPRAIVLLNVEPRAPLIPAALEKGNGDVVPVYRDLAQRLQKPGERSLPEAVSGSDEDEAKRLAYWAWFEQNYDHHAALSAVEAGVGGQKIGWIDYRFKLGDRFPHMTLMGRGAYETGIFAYRFVARGFRQGLRLVATLKSGPDLNVLAVFER